jgi:predicted Ser/Thr protein kinase
VAFLYDLLGASQEHKIKPKKFAQTDIDEVILGHTNEPEYKKLENNEFMEALRDRTVKIDIPYITKLAEEQKVAYVDITKWSLYRGEKYAWAYLANDYHPDLMGHIMIAELMVPLFTGENFDWPPYVKK